MPLLGPSLVSQPVRGEASAWGREGTQPGLAAFPELIVKTHASTDDRLRDLAKRIHSLENELQATGTRENELPVDDQGTCLLEVLFLEAEGNLGFELECLPDGRAVISTVQPGTMVEQLGVCPGDRLVSCNGILSESLGGFVELAALLNVRPMLLQVLHGCDSSSQTLLKKKNTAHLQKLATPSFFSRQPSIVDVLGATSPIAKWVLFLGGFSMFEHPITQFLYLVMFIVSFTCCFLSCAVNLYFQKPPYTSLWIDALTVYLHVFGLHTWLNWRRITRDPHLVGLVQRCLCRGHTSIRPDLLDDLCTHIRVLARIFAVIQIGAVALGYYVLPARAVNYWAEQGGEQQSAAHVFALVHGFIMYLAIPSHVPTIVAAYGMLFLVCRLHVLDVGRLQHLMGGITSENSAKLSTSIDSVLHMCVDLANDMQDKLTSTCRTLQVLLLHQMAYVFMQLFTTGVQAKNYYMHGVDPVHAPWSEILYTVWHLSLALLGLLGIAIAPAGVTAAFKRSRVHVFQGLRARGADQRFARLGAEDVAYSMIGFHCFGAELSPQFVSSFISVVFIGLALIIDLES